MSKFWAGIGSRSIDRVDDEKTYKRLIDVAGIMATMKYTLRSGGALGADTAFEIGVSKVNRELREIYLPSYAAKNDKPPKHSYVPADPQNCALIARDICGHYAAMSPHARLLHQRNVCQILGLTLDNPVAITICWTLLGSIEGGSATAINLSLELGIPVVNLGDKKFKNMTLVQLIKYIKNELGVQ